MPAIASSTSWALAVVVIGSSCGATVNAAVRTDTVVLEVEVTAGSVPALGTSAWNVTSGPARGAVAGRAVRVDVQVGEVALAQRDQVAVGAEVGLQVGRPAGRRGVTVRVSRASVAGGQVAVEGDGVAVHGRGRDVAGSGGARPVVAGDRRGRRRGSAPSPPAGVKSANTRQSPGVEVERRRPGAVGAERRVDVLEAGEVAADDDQVQPLLVLDVVAVTGCAVRAGDRERERDRAGRRRRGSCEARGCSRPGRPSARRAAASPAGARRARRGRRVAVAVGASVGLRVADRADQPADAERRRRRRRPGRRRSRRADAGCSCSCRAGSRPRRRPRGRRPRRAAAAGDGHGAPVSRSTSTA